MGGASKQGSMEGAAAEEKREGQMTQEEAEKQIVAKFQEMRDSKQAVASKISEMTTEKNEHSMGVTTLEPLDPNRKAWRLVGGVLVERTCGEVLPAVRDALAQIEQVLASLQKQYDDKEVEINEFMEKYNIRLQGQPPPQAKAEAEVQK